MMSCLSSPFRLGSRGQGISVLGAAQIQTYRSYASRSLNRRLATPFNAQGTNEFRKTEQAAEEKRALERNYTRDWKAGDIYAPHDLSAAEARKWKKRVTPTIDAFDALSLNPLDLYKNFSVMSEYMTEMGRIRHSNSTGLRAVNQRKIAKAIRRAVALGLMPSVHRHPELLKRQAENNATNTGVLSR